MPFSLEQYLIVSVVLFLSSIVLGAVGFAAGLFGIPLLVIAGISFPDAVAMSLVAAAPQNLIPCWQLRREIDFRLPCGRCSFVMPSCRWAYARCG